MQPLSLTILELLITTCSHKIKMRLLHQQERRW